MDVSLQEIGEKSRTEFRRQRRTNPLLWIPGIRTARIRAIAEEQGADDGVTNQLVTDFVLGKKATKLRAPAVLRP